MYNQVTHLMMVCIYQYKVDMNREMWRIDQTEGGGKGKGGGKKIDRLGNELEVVVGMRELGMHRERKCQ